MAGFPDSSHSVAHAVRGQVRVGHDRRLADFISAAVAAGDRAPETLRRLMHSVLTHQADQLQDDASIVVLEWRAGQEHDLRI